MKNLIFYITISMALLTPIKAQSSSGLIAVIYSKPDISMLQEFSSSRYGFKVTFAGIPSESKEYLADVNTFTFSAKQIVSSETVKVSQLKTGEVDNISESKIFEQKKNEYLSVKTDVLEYEKEITVGTREGREYGINQGGTYRKIRVIVFKNNIYELSTDVGNWHIMQPYYKDKVKDLEDESLRFFESFQFQPISITGSGNITG